MGEVRLGIVGHEAAKFTQRTEEMARWAIHYWIKTEKATTVISGGCHLGGIDKWAIEEAEALGVPTVEHLPKKLQWEGGYKQRNLKIAEDSDIVICIVVKELPEGYKGMRFKSCYHCGTDSHVKSGGCWTLMKAGDMGKRVLVVEIQP